MTQGGALAGPVSNLAGAGPSITARLEKIGLSRVADLIFHLPLRYEDRTRVVPMGGLRPGDRVLVQGTVQLAEVAAGRRRRLVARISDGTGSLTLQFFHFYPNQVRSLRAGTVIQCFGEARRGAVGLQMVHPEYSVVGADEPPEEAGTLTPIYPATEGVNQPVLRRLVEQALAFASEELEDLLPAEWAAQLKLPGLWESLCYVHSPPAGTALELLESRGHPAFERLAFEELLAHHLSLRRARQRVQQDQRAPILRGSGRLIQGFRQGLPFSLTDAQERVDVEVGRDMASHRPMLRLVQGDVGSGKTVVAALAVLRAVESGMQAAVMAPTELLAEQHYRNFAAWLEPLGVPVVWLSGRRGAAARRGVLQALESGEASVAVGTHALFQGEVQFHRLGLVIVDEQHRFGVHQRLALKEKGHRQAAQPHQLIMTATPIPRTLAMTAYADLDVSVIDELPPGRKPVRTVAVPASRREEVIEGVEKACREGRQAYWVCTLIEESDALQAEAAEETARRLEQVLPDLKVALVHGRMKAADKERIMRAFSDGDLDLLVATTVIEVGVDVPNASLMIIENAERLGLAQLHQLRGRVGRGSAASSCVLLYQAPLSEQARARLGVLRDSNDGFEIARRDLELRGPGELLGTRQTGAMHLRIADLTRDGALIPRVQKAAENLLADAPEAADRLIDRWVGEGERYSQV